MFRREQNSQAPDKEYVVERRLDLNGGGGNGGAGQGSLGQQASLADQWGFPHNNGTGMVLLVIHRNASGQLEVAGFERPEEACRFLEELVAAGTERESIHCFRAAKVEFVVTHRPVVGLVGL